MNVWFWGLVIYIVWDRLLTIWKVGDVIEITPGFAVVSVITGAVGIYGLTQI